MSAHGQLFQQVRILALRNVRKGTIDYHIRRIFRWYSKTFNTPIAAVEELPFEDVLLAYYEDHFENLSESRITEEVEETLLTDKQRREREIEEEVSKGISDDEFLEQAKLAEIERRKKAEERKAQEGKAEQIIEKLESLGTAIKKLDLATVAKPEIPREIKILPMPDLSSLDDLPAEEPGTAFGMKLKKRPKTK
jgi:hypothetical protein